MGQNFLSCDRNQQYLMPPSVSEWLAEDHLVWFLLEVVDELDLGKLYAAYRADGWGRAAHNPSMMLALLLYAYCLGERSSRRIEARCRQDVAFSGDHREQHPGSRHDRPVPRPPRTGPQRPVGAKPAACARRLAWSGWGCSRWTARTSPPRRG